MQFKDVAKYHQKTYEQMRETFDSKNKRIDELVQQGKDVNSANRLLRHDLDYITEQLA